jgi:hypothetical protein
MFMCVKKKLISDNINKSVCESKECNKKVYAEGWCHKHWIIYGVIRR